MLSQTEAYDLNQHCIKHGKFLLLVYSEDKFGEYIIGYKVYDYPPHPCLLNQTIESPKNWWEHLG